MRIDVEGGTVYLRDRLDFSAAAAIRYAILSKRQELESDDGSVSEDAIPDLQAAIAEHEMLRGIESWSFDEPVTRSNIRRLILADDRRATIVGMEADRLYADQVISPLQMLAERSSQPTPTDESTSAPIESSSSSTDQHNGSTQSPKHPKPLKPSSITTSPTAVTEPISV